MSLTRVVIYYHKCPGCHDAKTIESSSSTRPKCQRCGKRMGQVGYMMAAIGSLTITELTRVVRGAH